MPGDPNECRGQAKCCFKHAAAASSPLVRDNLLGLAQRWSRLARELEAGKRYLDALGEEFPVEKPSPPRDQVA